MTTMADAGTWARPASGLTRSTILVAMLAACAATTTVGTALSMHLTGLWVTSTIACIGIMGGLVATPMLAAMGLYHRGFDALARGFAERGDSEQEQIVIRVFFVAIVLAHTIGLAVTHPGNESTAIGILIMSLGMVVSWVFLAHLVLHPANSAWRKTAAMLADIIFLSAFLHLGGESVAVWYPIYLWVTLGNGFRYGLRSLFWCALLSVVCFGTVVAITPIWHEHLGISAGLLIALIILPTYVSKLIRSLRDAKAQAEKANEAKGRFLATMSHELRTPLNAMIGMGSIFRKTRLDPDQRDMLATMQDAAHTLLALINDVLDFSRIEAGRLRPDAETFDLHELINATLAMLRPQATTKGLRLKQYVDSRLPCFVEGWPQQLRQILTNLVANAIKFTDAGEVSVRLEPVVTNGEATRLRIIVTDQGIGMSAETRNRIFQPFTQADGTVTRRYGGTGLGLAIVRQLVDLMGGDVSVDTELGEGSTFTVEVPLKPDHGAKASHDLTGSPLMIFSNDDVLVNSLNGIARNHGCTANRLQTLDQALAEPSADAPRRKRVAVVVDARGSTDQTLRFLHDNPSVPPMIVIAEDRKHGEQFFERSAAEMFSVVTDPVDEATFLRALRSIAPPSSLAEAPPEDDEQDEVPQRKLRVLLAEDNPVNQKVISRILTLSGHETHIVGDGEAALEALDDGEFDIALMDINMPKMSGYEVTKFYRMTHLGERRLPIVALTADATSETKRLCDEAGLDAVLTKPIEASRLIDAIQSIVAEDDREIDILDDPPEGVTPIASHPKFARQSTPIVNDETLIALETLGGGSNFLTEVVETFRADARDVLDKMIEAANAADASAFRDHAHSLRSSAANVGASRLCEALLAIKGITERELRRDGAAHIEMLRQNFATLDRTLQRTVQNLAN